MFVLSDSAASRATRSSWFIVSFIFCVPLINGIFEAAKVIECTAEKRGGISVKIKAVHGRSSPC